MTDLKAAFALLPNQATQNRACQFTMRLHASFRVRWVRLRPHVSLKQPFSIDSVNTVEQYFDRLAKVTAPIKTTLDKVEARSPPPGTHDWIIWASVRETTQLRLLHERLNQELTEVVTDPSAAFDGESYRFHMSLALVAEPRSAPVIPANASELANLPLELRHIAMFVYDGLSAPGWQCMTYKVLPLGGSTA